MHACACAGTCFQTPTEGACQTLQTAECFDYRVDQIKAIPHIWYRFDEKPDGLKLKALAWIYSSYYRSLLSMTRFSEISGSDRCTGDRLLGGNEKVLTGGSSFVGYQSGENRRGGWRESKPTFTHLLTHSAETISFMWRYQRFCYTCLLCFHLKYYCISISSLYSI